HGHRPQAVIVERRCAPVPPAPATPPPPRPLGGGGEPRRRGRGSVRGGNLRRRPERVRVLRALAGRQGGERDGRVAPASRSRVGDQDHRQGHVPHLVIVQKYGGTSVGSAARIRRVSRRI